MAGWARPETFMFLIFSCCYSFLYSLFSEDKRYIFVAIASLLPVGLFLMAGIMLFDPSFSRLFWQTLPSSCLLRSNSTVTYDKQLGVLADDLDRGALKSFLSKTRHLIWLIDLGVLIGNSIAGIFYPYIPFFVFGFFGLSAKLRKDPRVTYLFTLVMLGYGLLFVHVLESWYLEHRFLHIIILPGSILAAFGIEKTTQFFQAKMGWKASVAVIVISLYIIGFGLGKEHKEKRRRQGGLS